ncbi:hypothetical protein QUA81_21910 [Microcoleus sp. F6_B4]
MTSTSPGKCKDEVGLFGTFEQRAVSGLEGVLEIPAVDRPYWLIYLK